MSALISHWSTLPSQMKISRIAGCLRHWQKKICVWKDFMSAEVCRMRGNAYDVMRQGFYTKWFLDGFSFAKYEHGVKRDAVSQSKLEASVKREKLRAYYF